MGRRLDALLVFYPRMAKLLSPGNMIVSNRDMPFAPRLLRRDEETWKELPRNSKTSGLDATNGSSSPPSGQHRISWRPRSAFKKLSRGPTVRDSEHLPCEAGVQGRLGCGTCLVGARNHGMGHPHLVGERLHPGLVKRSPLNGGGLQMIFYFDVRDGTEFSHDETGIDLFDEAAARHQATLALTEMARDQLPSNGDERRLVIYVRTDKGPQFNVSLDYEVLASGEKPAHE